MMYRFNTIGECCREWRHDKNITVADMAKYIGCCQQNITAFERGENISGRLLLEYVARGLMILGVDDDLYICKDKICDDIIIVLDPYEDAISRKWIKEAIHNFYQGLNHVPTEKDIQRYIEVAPSVNLQPKTDRK